MGDIVSAIRQCKVDLHECVMCFQLNASVISKVWTELLGLGGFYVLFCLPINVPIVYLD